MDTKRKADSEKWEVKLAENERRLYNKTAENVKDWSDDGWFNHLIVAEAEALTFWMGADIFKKPASAPATARRLSG